MTQQGRVQLKSWFETGDVPTEQQFADFIDSKYNFVDDGPIVAPATKYGLTVVGPNTINDLPAIPVSPVEFFINGILVTEGISNVGVALTVDPAILGYNISTTDKVEARFSS